MREARHGAAGLSATGSSRARATSRTRALSSPAIGERAQHPVVGGGLGAGAVGPAGVVGVLAVGDGGEAVRGDDLVGDAAEELVLAEEAAVGAVAAVVGVVALVGLDLDDPGADERAISWAPARSSRASDGETPRRARTWSGPRARAASASSTEESTPPENATPSGAACSRTASTRMTAASSCADHRAALVDIGRCSHGPEPVTTRPRVRHGAVADATRGPDDGRMPRRAPALHPDRLLPADPGVRAVARRIYQHIRALPIISPHGHVDARVLADDLRSPTRRRCSSPPTTTSPGCCTPAGCRSTASASAPTH